jgi:LCP family protein required for cell wall assembly
MGETDREFLLVREAGGGDARIDLLPAPLRIGRRPGNQVVLTDSYASGDHAEVVSQQGKRCVRDLGSTNGTRLNGRPISPRSLHPLRDGDVIQIGESSLTYRRQPLPRPGKPAGPPLPPSNGYDGLVGDGTDVVGLPTPSMVQPAVRPGGQPAVEPVVRPGAQPSVLPSPTPARPSGQPGPGRRVGAWVGRAVLRVVLVLFAVAVLLAGAGWLLAPSRVVLLVLGSDARPDELRRGEGGRTDTLLTVVADRGLGGVGLVSIPRDLWVEIPGHGEERINAAYTFGGAKTAERVVGDLLGVRVDRYLLIGLQGVRDVVDAAGGVDIVVEAPIHDDTYPTDDYGTMVLDIPAGRQHMDGETALRYARTRHQDNDFGRMGRQQRVMVALRSQLLKPINWWRVPGVLMAVRGATETDLNPLDLMTVALAFGAGPDEPVRLAIDLSLTEEFRGAGGAYLLRPTPALRRRVAPFVNPSQATVEVLNGSATTGLAKQTGDRLQAKGWRVVSVGDAGRAQAQSVVEFQPGLLRAGQAVAAALELPGEAVRESVVLPDGVDVRVTLGQQAR